MWPFRRKQNRAIFGFWDGSKRRFIDPMIPFRALVQHDEFDWETTPKAIDIGDLAAMGVTAKAIRDAFGIAPINESATSGLTESECVQLLFQFVDWMQGVKKKDSISQTSAPPTDPLATCPTPTGGACS